MVPTLVFTVVVRMIVLMTSSAPQQTSNATWRVVQHQRLVGNRLCVSCCSPLFLNHQVSKEFRLFRNDQILPSAQKVMC